MTVVSVGSGGCKMKRKTQLLLFSLLLILSSSIPLIFGQIPNEDHNQQQQEQENEQEFQDEIVHRSMFPDDFLFGTATSAYQIEGGYLEDGKSLSNWDVFTKMPGTEPNGDTGEIADDHYHRYMDDIDILSDLGVDAYRFSISWSRILPKGRFGDVNPYGVMFYNKIIDKLLLRGIKPFVTIHHNDIPQELEDRYGSWLSPLIQEDYVHFAKICFENFGDRVKHWITINEPNINTILGYILGQFPPKHCSPPFGTCSRGNSDLEPLLAAHNMLLSHAKAVQLYRDQFQAEQAGVIGLCVHGFHYEPYRDDEFSHHAVDVAYSFEIAWIVDPLIYGEYPSLMRKYLGDDLPKFSREEAKLMKGSVHFIGLNHYSSLYAIDCVHYSSDCLPQDNRPIRGFTTTNGYRDGIPIGDEMGYERFFVVPYGMEKITDFVRVRYPNTTIYITENGYTPHEPETLQDSKRINYHQAYLAALAKAMRKGAKVRGYFAWTLMDNFEWLQGYDAYYGLYQVDRTTLKRTPKQSAKWYAHFLANKGQQNHANSTLNSLVLTKNNNTSSCKFDCEE